MNNDIQLIDDLEALLKKKVFDVGYTRFDVPFLLLLAIIRYEILTEAKLSDKTAAAVVQMFAFQSFEFYYRDFPVIYEKSSDLSFSLNKYNEKLANHESGAIGTDIERWVGYFASTIRRICER